MLITRSEKSLIGCRGLKQFNACACLTGTRIENFAIIIHSNWVHRVQLHTKITLIFRVEKI